MAAAEPTRSEAPDARALERRRRRAARHDAPWLHGEVARRMADRLPAILRQPSTVLDWWGHMGASAAALAAAYPQARHVVVEPDAALLARSTDARRAPWWSPRRWGAAPEVLSDTQALPVADLLWANMTLHSVAEPQALMAQWRRATAHDGFLMFSTLGPDTLGQLRELYAAAGWGPPTQDYVDMHDIGDALLHAGFADPVMDQESLTLSWATPEALLGELRTMGNNAHSRRHAALRTPRWRQRLLDALRAQAGADGRIALRFEIVYGHAFNTPPRVKVAERAEVSLETMRAMVRAGRTTAPDNGR